MAALPTIILFGAPGCGKGTQGELLSAELGYKKLSTGDLLRKEIASGSKLGQEVEAIITRGDLVSDEIVDRIIRTHLAELDGKPVYFDGYPRTVPQAASLRNALGDSGDKVVVLSFEIDETILVERLAGRLVCQGCEMIFHAVSKAPQVPGECDSCSSKLVTRPDDTEERVRHRLSVYREQTLPVKAFYQGAGTLKSINAAAEKSHVFSEIRGILG